MRFYRINLNVECILNMYPDKKAMHSITINLAPEFKRKLKIKHTGRSAVLSLYAVVDNKDFQWCELCTHG